MLRAAPIAIALAGLVSGLSTQLRAPEWGGHLQRFLQNEPISFWLVTQLASGERRPIPDGLLLDQRIVFNRPDGSIRVDRRPMSIDSWQTPGGYGSRYRWTLKGETPQLGRWKVVYEMGHDRWALATFSVEAPAGTPAR